MPFGACCPTCEGGTKLSAENILPLDTEAVALEVVGGKGRSLAEMAAAGFPVPSGFILAASAYSRFVAENGLRTQIIELAKPEIIEKTISFESSSERIRTLFEKASISSEMDAEIRQAYGALGEGEPAVAVRSSANAEDLPDLSFAGQQDTYLNVRGEEALMSTVRACWASLWTSRAISYRHEHGIDQDKVAMAVVVQAMVPSEASGILFTANPASGERSEMIVNASYGLGEAVVGGEVAPDTFVIDRDTLTATETIIGAKDHMIVPADGQGTARQDLTNPEREQASLKEPELRELAQLAIKVEQHFDGVPQDIEWSVADDRLWLLQSRPITSLPPAPLKDVRWERPAEMPEWCIKGAMMRKNIVELMTGPVSPLFEDLYLKDAIGRRGPNCLFLAFAVNGYAYAAWGIPPGRVFPGKEPLTPDDFTKRYQKVITTWRKEALPDFLAAIDQWRDRDLGVVPDDELLFGIASLTSADAELWFAPKPEENGTSDPSALDPAVGTHAVISFQRGFEQMFQSFLQKAAPGENLISAHFLSGLRSVSMAGQDELSDIAELIRADETLTNLVIATPARRLATVLRRHDNARIVTRALDHYIDEYGHQSDTLDFAEPTLGEDPLPLMLNLKSMVQDTDRDPDAIQIRITAQRQAALRRARETMSESDFCRLREWLWVLKRSYPDRDESLFYMGAGWPVLRRLALELGRRMVQAGTFAREDDVFFVTRTHLENAIAARKENRALPELMQMAAGQRELREARKRLTPPDTVPPGTESKHFGVWGKVANRPDGNTLNGNACSPGKVTARASLILSPADFGKMLPDTVLVCPMTTPTWTHLFSQAKGLVTDVGGILSHGSIVAREYGIPAVLGAGVATERIKHGQMIGVDGDAGVVSLLTER